MLAMETLPACPCGGSFAFAPGFVTWLRGPRGSLRPALRCAGGCPRVWLGDVHADLEAARAATLAG